MRVVHLGAYQNSYGFIGNQSERDSWCDRAASIWPNAGDREDLRVKCKAAGIFDPWSAPGKLFRGLPANWSTDPKIVGAGAVGAVVGIVREAEQQVAPLVNPPPVTRSPPSTEQSAPPTVWPKGPSILEENRIVFPLPGAMGGGSASVNPMMLVVGALGLGALAFLVLKRKKRTPALSGYSRRRRRR
jgi:LPXTG-motif cell wall-anchored protein